jgi:ADP-ribose pyrophosphatase YjhB (NUDIX family)
MWNIPGGTVLFGENLESAVKRIAKEETGLNVRIKKQLGIKEYSKKDAFGQAISVIYLTDVLSGKLNGNEYGKDVRFFKQIPKKTIKVQKEILKNMLGMK